MDQALKVVFPILGSYPGNQFVHCKIRRRGDLCYNSRGHTADT